MKVFKIASALTLALIILSAPLISPEWLEGEQRKLLLGAAGGFITGAILALSAGIIRVRKPLVIAGNLALIALATLTSVVFSQQEVEYDNPMFWIILAVILGGS